jgi:hypothetical protein
MIIPVLIVTDQASAPLEKKVAALSSERVAKVAGPRLREFTRDHIKRLPKNKKGWPSTGFWEDAARGCTWEVIGDVASRQHAVLIRVNKVGFKQRYYGGPIRPVSAKALTLPISPKAYGKSASEFPGLFLMVTRKGAYLVRYAGGTTAKGRFKKQLSTLEFLFKLSPGVMQKGNRDIVPSPIALRQQALLAVGDYVREVKAGGGN